MNRDNSRNSFVGNGRVDAVQTAQIVSLADDTMPTIAIGSDLGPIAGEVYGKRISKQSITVDADGSGGELLITLKRYIKFK